MPTAPRKWVISRLRWEPGRKRADGAQNVLRATFIQTNLKWELVNSSLNTPVLWDRYNYAVYKVSVENVSDTRDSEIDFINYVLMFDAATGSTSGIRAEDLLTWKSTDGSVSFSKNTSMKYDDTGATYIGKPKQGGALIYDVSKLTDEEIRQIDMVDFSKCGPNFNLTEMPYATGGKSQDRSPLTSTRRRCPTASIYSPIPIRQISRLAPTLSPRRTSRIVIRSLLPCLTPPITGTARVVIPRPACVLWLP